MSITHKNLCLNDQIAGTADSSVDTLYTSSNVAAVINQATAYNGHTGAVVLYVYILASGSAATSVDPVAIKTVNNGETVTLADLLGHTVPKNGTIKAYAGTTNVVRVSISGVEIS